MNAKAYAATTLRILHQLRRDHRTVGLIVAVPSVLMVLLYFIYQNPPIPGLFGRVGVVMLGILPFITMFLITAIAMQRERSSGTLERLMTTPIGKFDLIAGYGTAFSLAAAVQSGVACIVGFGFLGLHTDGHVALIILVAMLNAALGVALGLLASAFARTEFQAVQFMPMAVAPQLFLCGLLVDRAQLPDWLQVISNALPLSYSVDALKEVAGHVDPTSALWFDLLAVATFALVALALGAATLRRRTE